MRIVPSSHVNNGETGVLFVMVSDHKADEIHFKEGMSHDRSSVVWWIPRHDLCLGSHSFSTSMQVFGVVVEPNTKSMQDGSD